LPDGTLSFVNTSYCRYFDKNPEELVSKDFFQFIPEKEREKIRMYFQSFSEKMSVKSYEHQVVAPNGEVRWQRWTDRALFDEKGNLNQYQSVGHDITDQKQAEIDLQEKEQKLDRQAQHLEEVNTALKVLLEHREEEKKKLEGNILANAQKLIFPYIEKLENSRLDGENETYLSIIKSNLKHLISPFGNTLSSKYAILTSTEIQVADLIKHGRTSKEIASLLNVSLKAISFHRGNIRKKLGLVNKKINLTSHLQSLAT
jgi:PAS domain S-box-containing protein